jgi:hypothetical protein
MGSRNFKNFMGYDNQPDPKELRLNFDKEELKDGSPFPNPLTYEDIDREFKKWVEESLEISYEGKKLPTMTLFSNQRFSEYMQSWKFTDEDQNPILNFKSISRENNPKSGTINGESKNIPGEHTWLMKRVAATDKNGREYYIEYRMKQPIAVDLVYKVSLFTNKFELLNKFNLIVNDRFKAIDCYIRPNGHYISMKLNDISDDSEYSINDRQYYSQSVNIVVRAYIIPEDSFIVHEVPRLTFIGFDLEGEGSYADVEIGRELKPAELHTIITETNDCDEDGGTYHYRDATIKVFINPCNTNLKFNLDFDFTAKADQTFSVNARYYKIKINGVTVSESVKGNIPEDIEFKNGDLVKVCGVARKNASAPVQIVLKGFTKDYVEPDDGDVEYEEEVIVKE